MNYRESGLSVEELPDEAVNFKANHEDKKNTTPFQPEAKEFESHNIARERIKDLLDRATQIHEMLDQLTDLNTEHIREHTSIDGATEPLTRAVNDLENAMRAMVLQAKSIFDGYSGQIKDVHFKDWQGALTNKE